jgi:hypothetical protein
MTHFIAALIGIWLMVAPELFAFPESAANNSQIAGPIIFTIGFTAVWEAMRNIRLLNCLIGLWLFFAPFILGYSQVFPIANDIVAGILVIMLSTIRGKKDYRFGGGWKALFESKPKHYKEAIQQEQK